MSNSTKRPAQRKPSKPRPDFPLFPHASGRWAKKIRGKFKYFGRVDSDPNGEKAIALWLEQKDRLLAGLEPRPTADGFTIKELLNKFLNAKRHLLNTGELTGRTFTDYHETARRVRDAFGLNRLVIDLTSEDFTAFRASLAKGRSLVSLGNEVQRARVIFNFAYQEGHIDRPVKFGKGFSKPSAKSLRRDKAAKEPKMFQAEEIRAILAKAKGQLRAMVLLGVNCGFGNHDCGSLPMKAVDLEGGWIDFPRPKTGVPRRCPLWKETVGAIREAIDTRPKPKDEDAAGLVFLTKQGRPWTRERVSIVEKDGTDGSKEERRTQLNAIAQEFPKLLKDVMVNQGGEEKPVYRKGVTFYALRHTHETVAGGCLDQVAVDAVMGHVPAANDMGANYREQLPDDWRLRAVADCVHEWLFPPEAEAGDGDAGRDAGAKADAGTNASPSRKPTGPSGRAHGLRLFAG